VDIDGGLIYLEGPPESVKAAQCSLTAEIALLEKEVSLEVVRFVPSLDQHIIGKIREDWDVQISTPPYHSEIHIEGKKESVANARKEIMEIVARLEKETNIFVPHRFHAQIIGESVQRWRKEFPSVNISFPEDTITSKSDWVYISFGMEKKKCDVVNLRGNMKEVDKLCLVMKRLSNELSLNNFQDTMYVHTMYQDTMYYRHIIGKKGANINKIRDVTQTRIELTYVKECGIVVIGKQENVEKAIALFNKIRNK
jgi:polyribonucleotide nucleotidyltransferase